MRHLIYIGLIFLLGCSQADPVKEYLKSTHIIMCDQAIHLGQKVSRQTLAQENITHNTEIDTYYISCDRAGAMFVGTGDQSQLFQVKEASFNISADSTVKDIMGFWVPGEESGPSNDLRKARYEVEQALGKPSTIRPIIWQKDNLKLTFGSQRLEYGTLEYVQSTIETEP